ncbi:MAG TPA: PEGA domain-containing protein [Polyangiaceae bacterium]|nr:PEGA domain-containing protein [Polyangiaceae bacterium]
MKRILPSPSSHRRQHARPSARALAPALLAALLLAPPALARDPDPAANGSNGAGDDALGVARQHFARGVDLYRAGAYNASLAEFTRAYEISPNYRILYNMAQIQAQRQDYVQSLQLFTRYLQEGAGDIPAARVAAVDAETAELHKRVAELRVESNVEGATLNIDEVRTAQLPLTSPLLVNAGIHRLRVEKFGHSTVTKTVTVAGGETPLVRFELSSSLPPLELDALGPVPAPAPAPAAPPPAPAPNTSLWVGLAVTGALTVGTATCAVLTYRQSQLLDRRLSNYPDGLAGIDAARGGLRTLTLLTDTFALSSLVAAGVTTALQLTEQDDREDASHPQLGAGIGPGGASLWVRGAL